MHCTRIVIAGVLLAGWAMAPAITTAHEKSAAGKAREVGHAPALGQAGDPTRVSRTVAVEMTDGMRFIPARIEVKRGETVRFVVKNSGKVKHEMVLGTLDELKEHAALMRKFPEMENDDPNAVDVAPGKTRDLVWQFTRSGTFDFACLQPGHFEAGMRGNVMVSP
jgi:uncharacterized cupredoxin-like copper-binding protein